MYTQTLATLFLTLFSSAALAASTYQCDDQTARYAGTTFVVEDNGLVSFPNESDRKIFSGPNEIKTGETDDCLPHGTGGRLFENGGGPGYWVYRIPDEAQQAFTEVTVQLAIDADADNVCTYQVLKCLKQ